MVSVWAADITPLLIEETYQAYYDKVPEWRNCLLYTSPSPRD